MTVDNLDKMLAGAFDNALNICDQIDLSERVVAAIRRRQRQRMLVFGVIALIATAICVLNGLPLLAMVGSWLDTWLSQTQGTADFTFQIGPVLMLIATITFAGLLPILVEESI